MKQNLLLHPNIPDVNGEAHGSMALVTEDARTIHSASGNWVSDVTRQRFCKAAAGKIHPAPERADGEADDAYQFRLDAHRAEAERTAGALDRQLLGVLDALRKSQADAKGKPAPRGRPGVVTGMTADGWPTGPYVVATTDPMRLAEHYLKARATTETGELMLRRYCQEWWRFGGSGYRQVTNEEQAADFYHHLDRLYVADVDKDGNPTGDVSKLSARSTIVREVSLAAPACGTLTTGEMPRWLDGRPSPAPADVVAFANGLLDTAAYCRGEGVRLIPPTPEWFSGTATPYDFDPAARCDTWLQFLIEVFDGDEASIHLLQEWFGLQLVPDNKYERLMLLVGRPRAGKGTVLEAMTAMLGEDQAAVTSFAKLASRFGIHPLVGKLAAILPDAHVGRSTDDRAALEVIKSITGSDPQAVDRKGITELPRVRLACRFTVAVNELPKLPDDAGALKPRLLLLWFGKSFAGREKTGLKATIRTEAAGVALWALEGLRRLRERGTFTVPHKSQAIVDEFERTVSPVKNFLHEECEVGAGHWVCKDEFYERWVVWCKARGDEPGNLSTFGQKLIAAEPTISAVKRGPRGQQFPAYDGVKSCV